MNTTNTIEISICEYNELIRIRNEHIRLIEVATDFFIEPQERKWKMTSNEMENEIQTKLIDPLCEWGPIIESEPIEHNDGPTKQEPIPRKKRQVNSIPVEDEIHLQLKPPLEELSHVKNIDWGVGKRFNVQSDSDSDFDSDSDCDSDCDSEETNVIIPEHKNERLVVKQCETILAEMSILASPKTMCASILKSIKNCAGIRGGPEFMPKERKWLDDKIPKFIILEERYYECLEGFGDERKNPMYKIYEKKYYPYVEIFSN